MVGGNNAGKTALLEAISGSISHDPHRSLETVPEPGDRPNQVVSVDLDFGLTGSELEQALIENESATIPQDLCAPGVEDDTPVDRLLPVDPKTVYRVETRYKLDEQGANPSLQGRGDLGVGIEHDLPTSSGIPHLEFKRADTGQSWKRTNHKNRSIANLAQQTRAYLSRRIYLFEAERFNVGDASLDATLYLQTDASNLATVLHNLQARNRVRFDRLVRHVTDVFPEVEGISTKPIQRGERVEAHIWHVDPETEREDLTIPLNETGSGLGQAIAILYLLVTSDEPHVILIDEPQSFLHPGALRKLLSIMKQYETKHQFILATHAPSVIPATIPGTITNLKLEDGRTTAQTVDPSRTAELRSTLAEVGVRPSDLFGADHILWVEGPTEERVVPLIIQELLDMPLMGTEVLGVVSTGDFEAHDDKAVELAFDLYRKLSVSPTLVPPALSFVLDRENRSEARRQELRKQCPVDLHFLPRRMYENYLLHPQAIASTISATDGINAVGAEAVHEWIQGAQERGDFLDEEVEDEDTWQERVHAASLLEEMVPDLTDDQLIYRKVEHGRAITQWLIENDEDELEEVANLLSKILRDERSAS